MKKFENIMQNNEKLKMKEEKIKLYPTIDYFIFIDYSADFIGYNIIGKEKVSLLLEKTSKFGHLKDNILIFLEVLEFVGKHDNCAIFLSVDNNQFDAFSRLMAIVPHKEHVTIVKESELKKGSVEYKLSLIIDNMLVIERLSK